MTGQLGTAASYLGNIELGMGSSVSTDPSRLAVPFVIVHDVRDLDPRTRKALQQLSGIVNGLARTGQLRGTIGEPKLGFLADSTSPWGGSGNEPDNVNDALNRIAAALLANGITL